MRPSVYRDRNNVPGGIEAGRREHPIQLLADIAFKHGKWSAYEPEPSRRYGSRRGKPWVGSPRSAHNFQSQASILA
jgi:hypothetical protein